MGISKTDLTSLVEGTHGSPYNLLGLHTGNGESGKGVTIRTMQLLAERVDLIPGEDADAVAMKQIHPAGVFELTSEEELPATYRLRVVDADGTVNEVEDPYRFALQVSDVDMHLHGEGTHYRTYQKMGGHLRTIDGVSGVHFAVWAPNAIRVSVIGEFNRWDGRQHPMQCRGSSGLWELFLPGLGSGSIYKFEVKGPHDYLTQKSDPYGFASELRPRTASVVWDHEQYAWEDEDWMARRRSCNWFEKPISVYEVHPGSWKRKPDEGNRWLTYRELADDLIPHVQDLGFTHIELLPITEHPFDGSWGYQTIGYFSATSRFGTPDDLKYFIDLCHEAGIGVILDWVPAHFPKDGHGLAYFDGTHLYEHADPRMGEHMDWGTLIFNYGRNEVRTFLLSSAMYWADVFHIDGIRVDAVASMLYLDYSRDEGRWLPNRFGGRENLEAVDFLKRFNEVIHDAYPGFLTFAEESTAWPMVSRPTYLGGLGFDLKWNMGWMHDTLQYFTKDPVHRKFHHNDLTFSLLYAFSENFILTFSHDEVVHGKNSMLGKMPGDSWQQFANMRLLYALMFAHPGKKLLFMGQEFGQWNEWDCHESMDWNLLEYRPHQQLQHFLGDLNRTYGAMPPLHEVDFSWDGFEWIDFHDSEQSTLSFYRKAKDPEDLLVCIFNFTPVLRNGYRVGVPRPGLYEEVMNSDAAVYGGGNHGNAGAVEAESMPWMNQQHSAVITLPPLGAIYLRPGGADEARSLADS